MKRLIFLLLLLSMFSACKEEPDNASVVGKWFIKSYRYKVVDAGKIQTDQYSLEIGEMTFKEDGTGSVSLTVPVTDMPNNANIEWVEDPQTLNIIVNYKDGRFPRTYVPSYRGDFTLLTRKATEYINNKFMEVTIEIFFERR